MEPGIKTEVIGEKKQRSEAIKFAIKFAAIGVENRLVCRRLKTRSRVNHSAQIFLDIAITCHARKNILSCLSLTVFFTQDTVVSNRVDFSVRRL